jgi:hypothetical protein
MDGGRRWTGCGDSVRNVGARLVIVECVVPVELAMARVEGDRGHLAGNRDRELVARITAGWEELPEGDAVIRVDLEGAVSTAVRRRVLA